MEVKCLLPGPAEQDFITAGWMSRYPRMVFGTNLVITTSENGLHLLNTTLLSVLIF